MLRVIIVLLLTVPLWAAERLSERFVYVNSFYLVESAARAPDMVALLVLWPDGRLQQVDCAVRLGKKRGSIRMLFDGSTQVATGRWALTEYGTVGVKVPRFIAHSTRAVPAVIEGYLQPEGKARGRLAARLRSINTQFVAVSQIENLAELEAVLETGSKREKNR